MPKKSGPDGRAAQDIAIASEIESVRGRLWSFIQRRVPDRLDAEDILQDVFYEVVVAYRLVKPIEEAGAWMFRVARNRIIDLFRKTAPAAPRDVSVDDEAYAFGDLLPSPDGGPEAEFARGVLLEELAAALDELPAEQREVFIAHQLEGRSFKELAAETGVSVNTLLSRKHYAVLHLRRRLRDVYDELKD